MIKGKAINRCCFEYFNKFFHLLACIFSNPPPFRFSRVSLGHFPIYSKPDPWLHAGGFFIVNMPRTSADLGNPCNLYEMVTRRKKSLFGEKKSDLFSIALIRSNNRDCSYRAHQFLGLPSITSTLGKPMQAGRPIFDPNHMEGGGGINFFKRIFKENAFMPLLSY